jgi:hypothetical protein
VKELFVETLEGLVGLMLGLGLVGSLGIHYVVATYLGLGMIPQYKNILK